VPFRQREARFHGRSGHAMKSFSIVILGGGVVAGYATKEFVAQGGKTGTRR
jgi:hypothetical protein